jgi:hypothetical protein
MTVVLCSDHFYNCPICGKQCRVEEGGTNYVQRMYGSFQQFLCNGPLAVDPLHYYSHMVAKSEPNKIAYQEFSLDLGSKSILFATNYVAQTTMIKQSHDAKFLELHFIISPDFPDLTSLKKKVRTAITFS